jgi:signal transduction histidine kinase
VKRSLTAKLILSYLVVALIVVLVVTVVIRLTSGQSLMSLIVEQQNAALTEAAQNFYAENGSLDGFFNYYMRGNPPQNSNYPKDDLQSNPPKARDDFRGLYGLVDAQYRALMPTFGYAIGDEVPAELIQDAIAIEADGETIAWILPDTHNQFSLSPEERMYLQRTTLAVALAAAAGVLAAVGMGFVLARGLTWPIRKLTQASQAMASGDLHQEVAVTSQDELGLLTRSFNKMSADLLHADQQRKRLTADITHDLSTPLQIISGYVEMFEEGSVEMTPQRLEIIKTEIEHLRRLVGDLTTLSQAEGGGLNIQTQPVSPLSLLERVYQTYLPIAETAGIRLVLDARAPVPDILADEERMLQVLKNLVDNAMRYTPSAGTITLSAGGLDAVELSVRDTGAGISAEDLPYVFERFYRADKNRESNAGKMGLGLAICKALVSAQGGTIRAESAGRGLGTAIVVSFPKAQ